MRVHPSLLQFPLLLTALLLSASSAIGQETDDRGGAVLPQDIPKEARAVPVPAADAIQVDGRLDEAAWEQAPALDDFVQKEPVEGVPPAAPTVVRFVYDQDALYVGARMESRDGRAGIRTPLSRRDRGYSSQARSGGQGGGAELADYILISLDTYLDRRTAYSFGVTAAGVRLDHQHLSDSETDIDQRFDPVWETAVTVDENGWTAEMWIPWSQLRFTRATEQIWGLNIHRWTPARNADDYWVPVPRTEEGWASRFGVLRGIRDVEVTRRLEILPYATGSSTMRGDADPADPFDDGLNLEGRAGADLKMGVGPNLTLDATVTPDFGQVEVDPAVINLSADEVFFTERRPFFTEGSSLLSGREPNYFYSRRIGAPPPGSASGDYVDAPGNATILGAAKLTGRLPSGTSLGVLGAVTGEEHARTFDLESDSFDDVRVAPRAYWSVARMQQEFGEEGSTTGLMVTGVHRDLQRGQPLAGLLARNAVTASGDVLWRLGGGMYELEVSGGVSYIDGDEEAMLRAQRSSRRYLQRPDADHVEVDPDRTSMAGGKFTIQAEKLGGEHWLWDFYFDIESPEVEFNDLGRLTWADGVMTVQGLTYRETEPGPLFRSYRFRVGQNSEWSFGGDRQRTNLDASANVTLDNFWTVSASTQVGLRAQDHRLTRGGPSVGTPRSWNHSLDLRSSQAEQTRWSVGANYGEDELGGMSWQLEGDLGLVPAPRWQLSVGPSIEREVNPRQYVTVRDRAGSATYGSRYIFAFIDRTTLAMETRVDFTLMPDLNLELYAQPFAASGRYYDFGELPEARSRRLRTYGTDGTSIERQPDGSYEVQDGAETFSLRNRDFNVRSFRSTAVLRWEWTPGSTLYLVWQQDRSRERELGERARVDDVFRSVAATGDNFFAIKASYWIGS